MSAQAESVSSGGQGELQLWPLDRYQRLDVISHVEGFLPASRQEQTRVMMLLDIASQQDEGIASVHLARVFLHQRDASSAEDPKAACRSITRNFVEWAIDARDSGLALDSFNDELKYASPYLLLSDAVELDQERALPLLRTLKFFHLAELKSGKTPEDIGLDPQKEPYTLENKPVKESLESAMSSMSVHDARMLISAALENEDARLDFWAARLRETGKFSLLELRAIALSGLDEIEYDAR